MMIVAFESLTIASTQEIHEHLLSFLLSDDEPLELDLSSVNKIDLCGVQLLLSLQKSLEQKSKSLQLINCTNSVSDALVLCGLENILGCNHE